MAFSQCTPTIPVAGVGIADDITRWYYAENTVSSVVNIQPSSVAPMLTNDPNLGYFVHQCERDSDWTCDSANWYPSGAQTPTDILGHPYKCLGAEFGPNSGDTIGKGSANPGWCLYENRGTSDYGQCDFWGFFKEKFHYVWKRDWKTTMADSRVGGVPACCVFNPNPAASMDVGQPASWSRRRTDTCHPDYTPSSPICYSVMLSYCSATNWDDKCSAYVDDASGWAKNNLIPTIDIFRNALSQWLQIQKETRNNVINENDPFLPIIQKYCRANVGMCDAVLKEACSSTPRTSISSTTPNTTAVCSCFLPSLEYLLPGIIPPECDSICMVAQNAYNGVPIGEWNSKTNAFVPKICQQTSCVMDNVTVDLVNSTTGGISFSQVCSGCPNGGCTCVMNGVDIDVVNSTIGGKIDFITNCTGCPSTTPNGLQPFNCNGSPWGPQPGPGPSPSPTPKPTPSPFKEWWAWIKTNKTKVIVAVVVLLLLIILIITGLVVTRKSNK